MKQPTDAPSPAPRAIPPIPGGGSWRFDETAWAWQPNAPTDPQIAAAPAAAQPTAEQVAAPANEE